MAKARTAPLIISEIREFAEFAREEQLYIQRSLDLALGRGDAFRHWVLDACDEASLREQARAYCELAILRQTIPNEASLDGTEAFMGGLLRVTAFDLTQERLDSFSAYRFLYERLLGAGVRPWLPSAFCGAAALPQLRPARRKLLLKSLSEAAATAPGWSEREPSFYPERIDSEPV